MKFRKKPIEAVQLLWSTWGEMCDHANVGCLADGQPEGAFLNAEGMAVDAFPGTEGGNGRIGLLIPTREGLMIGVEGDWIIRGVAGELYPCAPDIFAATYGAHPTSIPRVSIPRSEPLKHHNLRTAGPKQIGLIIPVTGPILRIPIANKTSHAWIKNALDGGWLEGIRLPKYVDVFGYVDEEGLLKQLPPNPRASTLAGQTLVGPCVLVGDNGSIDTVGIPAKTLARLETELAGME